jgi:shikimate dehydrogenase
MLTMPTPAWSITGNTRLVGLVGWPVEHSLSPAMHNAAFQALGMDWRYVPLPVPPDQVGAAIRGLGALGVDGVNVTVPHKQAVIPHLNSVTPRVQQLGAVNTIVIGRGADGPAVLSGFNTDDKGFIRALREGGFEPTDCRALVLGAGGSARAIVFGLIWSGATSIVVLNRTLERAEALVADLKSHFPDTTLKAASLTSPVLEEHAASADLLVNTTSLGMWPHVKDSPWPESLPFPQQLTVFDLVYRPRQTRLLQQAETAGAPTVDGLGMLLYQAALAFEMWTGEWPPVEVMWAALEKRD